MSNQVTDPGTAAATYEFVVSSVDTPATVAAEGLAGAEVVDVQYMMGLNYVNSGVQLTVAEPVKKITAVGKYRLNKGITAGAVALHFENML